MTFAIANLKNAKTPIDSKIQCAIIENVTFKNTFTTKYGQMFTYYITSGLHTFEYVSKSDNQTHFQIGDYAWFEITNKKNPYNRMIKIKKSHEAAWHTKGGHLPTQAPAQEVAPKAETPVQPQAPVQTVLSNDKKQALISYSVALKAAIEFVNSQDIPTGYKKSDLVRQYAKTFYQDMQDVCGVKFA